MTIRRIERKTSSQEQDFLKFVRRTCESRARGVAVHLSLAGVGPVSYENWVFAINTFTALAVQLKGRLFVMRGRDLVLVFDGVAGDPAVVGAILTMRRLLDLPATEADESSLAGFVRWYDLAHDGPRLSELAETLAAGRGGGGDGAAAPTLAAYARFMETFETTELAGSLRRQPVCSMQTGLPEVMFHELYVSIADLQARLAPGLNLLADRYLFQHVTHALDRRVLALLAGKPDWLPPAFSLNLNVTTILSPDFAEFDALLGPERRPSVVLEFARMDALADIGACLVARDRARAMGYQVCLDGLTAISMPYIRLQDLDFDLLKITWSPEMAAEGQELRQQLLGVIGRCAGSHMVLCRCDTVEAIAWGQELGIPYFQGRAVDGLIAAQRS